MFRVPRSHLMSILLNRAGVTSLQRAGGIYGLVALSPSVGTYAGGRFTSHVPIRVVQPATHPNNSLNLKTEDNKNPIIKQEGESRRRQRQASIPAVTTSYRAEVGACMARQFARDSLLAGTSLHRRHRRSVGEFQSLVLIFTCMSSLLVLVPQPFSVTHNLTPA